MKPKKIRYFICESPMIVTSKRQCEEMKAQGNPVDLLEKTLEECYGWGNGYVVIPPGHPLYGENFDENLLDCERNISFVHFGRDCDSSLDIPKDEQDHLIVGFDTYQYREDKGPSPYTKEYVEAQAKHLAEQLQAMWLKVN